MVTRKKTLLLGVVIACLGGRGSVSYGAPPLESAAAGFMDMSLEQLLDMPIRAASGFDQTAAEAPSSVTILTAWDLRASGYLTLAEALSSAAGFSVSNDRSYDYLAVRGFNRPGDFNGRTLVLIDGARVNDPLYGSGRIGSDLPIDMDLIDRIEIVRGPSSSLYGSGAFFGVVNIVTKEADDIARSETTVSAGSNETFRGRFSLAGGIGKESSVLLSGTLMDSKGPDLYFPRFDSQETNHGVAKGLDGEELGSLFLKARHGRWTLHTAHVDRLKGRPTASYGTIFNHPDADDRDVETMADLSWAGSPAQSWTALARVGYQRYEYEGRWPYEYADEGDPPDPEVDRDLAISETLDGEVRLTADRIPGHKITAGVELRDTFRMMQRYETSDGPLLDSDRGQWEFGACLQDEVRFASWGRLNAGLRYGHLEPYGDSNVSPRAALILEPAERSVLKLIYGTAFRAPNAYERYYHDGEMTMKVNPDLKPETIRSYELVYEQGFRKRLHVDLSLYRYRIEDLITQTIDPSDDLLVFRNLDQVEANGVEVGGRIDLTTGWVVRGSYSISDAADARTGARLTNSPEGLACLSLGIPIDRQWLTATIEGRYVSERLTVQREPVDGYALVRATLLAGRIARRWDLSLTVNNLVDERYVDPVGLDIESGVVAQNGRTLSGKVGFSF